MWPDVCKQDTFPCNLGTAGENISTIENLTDRRAPTLLKGIWSFISLYNKQKYSIFTMFIEKYFEVLEADLNNIQATLDTIASRYHVPKVEWKIRSIKGRVRAILSRYS